MVRNWEETALFLRTKMGHKLSDFPLFTSSWLLLQYLRFSISFDANKIYGSIERKVIIVVLVP